MRNVLSQRKKHITQIEKTYYHTTEAKMISNALADYEYKDGLLVPIVTA